MMVAGLRPEEVFTPRASKINERIYVPRPDLEDALTRALKMPKHVVIHGESGTGKSWLYKRVFKQLACHYEVANMGLCSSSRSISDVLATNHCDEIESTTTVTRKFGIKPIVEAGVEHQSTSVIRTDAFLEASRCIAYRANGKPAFLVFDNLEHITANKKLVAELKGILLLVDDERYAESEVKIILVGTSNEVRLLISNLSNSAPIANRLTEIPEVSRLTVSQADHLVKTGLFDLLGCELKSKSDDDFSSFLRWVRFHSDSIPQFVQELCLYIAWEAEKNAWLLDSDIALSGAKEWIKSSLVKDVTRVESNLNSKNTKIGRKNQVIYCLGACQSYDFTSNDIEKLVHHNFPKSTNGVTLTVSQLMSELVSAQHPIITKSPKPNHYRFVDPKFRIVARWLLYKDPETEVINFRNFDDAIRLFSAS